MVDLNCRLLLPLALMLASASPLSAQPRHAEAHVHGTGLLMMVVDGSTVSIELTIPGSDIVGFERQATTPEEQSSVENAIATLSQPTGLFAFTPDTACTVKAATAEFRVHDDHHHAEFTASYALDCLGLAAGDVELRTGLFDQFSRVEALNVDGLVDGVAQSGTLTRQQPAMTLR
jgi:hypothetical protein